MPMHPGDSRDLKRDKSKNKKHKLKPDGGTSIPRGGGGQEDMMILINSVGRKIHQRDPRQN